LSIKNHLNSKSYWLSFMNPIIRSAKVRPLKKEITVTGIEQCWLAEGIIPNWKPVSCYWFRLNVKLGDVSLW